MPVNDEHRALIKEIEAAMKQSNDAPLQRDKCFSWQCLQISQAMSRMYVAGMKAQQINMEGRYHQWHLENAAETNQ